MTNLRPIPSALQAMARVVTAEQLDDALRVLSVRQDGCVPAWASPDVLVLCDALDEAGVGVLDFSLSPDDPAFMGLDWPRTDGYTNLRRWLWWMSRGFGPRTWDQADTDRVTMQFRASREPAEVAAAEARLGLARSKPPPKRERIRAHNRAAQEAMRRGLSSGDVDL